MLGIHSKSNQLLTHHSDNIFTYLTRSFAKMSKNITKRLKSELVKNVSELRSINFQLN